MCYFHKNTGLVLPGDYNSCSTHPLPMSINSICVKNVKNDMGQERVVRKSIHYELGTVLHCSSPKYKRTHTFLPFELDLWSYVGVAPSGVWFCVLWDTPRPHPLQSTQRKSCVGVTNFYGYSNMGSPTRLRLVCGQNSEWRPGCVLCKYFIFAIWFPTISPCWVHISSCCCCCCCNLILCNL